MNYNKSLPNQRLRGNEDKKMNLANYVYYDLNISEVENVVEVLHNKTDSYLEMLFDEEWYGSVETIQYLMLEYIKTVRTQTNILCEVKSRLEKTNNLCNGLENAKIDKLNLEMAKRRYA